MAYVEKYHHTYCDIHGNTFRVSLRVLDYSGGSTEVECGTEQFIIERESSAEVKLGGVYPTRATATFISEAGFDLQELYTGDESTYQLVRLKNGQLDWQGSVVPDGFQQDNYDTTRSQLIVKAMDNLAALKGKLFVDEVGDNYGDEDGEYMQSFLWVIKEGLKKTGFLMPIWSMVDIKHITGGSETKIYTVYADVFPSPAPGTVWIMDYTRQLKTQIGAGSEAEIAGRKFLIDSVTNVPTIVYDVVVLTPDASTPITGSSSHGNMTLSVSTVIPMVDTPDPLTTTHNVRTWIRDSNIEGKTYFEARGGAMSTWDVLDAIARQFGMIIQQNNGHWELKRWNADKIGDGQYQWFVYNSEGVETGREDFGGDVLLPCVASETSYRVFGSRLMMDRVLKYAVVNYRYKYNQEGDSLINMVVNGNFEGPYNPYPKGWDRIKADNYGTPPDMSLEQLTTGLPAGLNYGVRIHNYSNRRTVTNLTVLSNAQVNKGDRLEIFWWERKNMLDDNLASMGIYAISLFENINHAMGKPLPGRRAAEAFDYNTKAYDLVNAGRTNGRGNLGSTKTRELEGRWRDQQESGSGYKHFRLTSALDREYYGEWCKIIINVGEVPIGGYIKLEVLGLARSQVIMGESLPPAPAELAARYSPIYAVNPNRPIGSSSSDYEPGFVNFYGTDHGIVPGASLDVTGMFIGKLIDPDNEAVPQIDPFMYPDFQAQLTRNFSDTIPEIEILTGDDYGEYAEDRISSMWTGGQRTTMWDTWDNRFGWSRQGLVLAKSVMEMYWKPTRLLDCEINLPNLHWSSRIQFEEMPGKRFVILRGSIGGYRSTFRGTITEIHDEADPVLPPGGNDGGNTVEPNWQPTGVTRCVRGASGENTGRVEEVQTDINRASPTYGQERWVDAGENTSMCPIGDPIDLYWGEQSALDVISLRYFPVAKNGDDYMVQFSNDGSDVYLRLLHRSSLGTVRSILYPGNYESISGWVYEADVSVNGYTYKHLRLTWLTGVYMGLPITFKIN